MELIRRSWSRLRADNPRWVMGIFAALWLIGTIYFFTVRVPKYDLPTPLISGDGRYYYAYLTSLLVDGDVDFTNQYANPKQKNPWGYRKTPTGKPANPFPIGPALAWSPFFVLGRGIAMVSEPPAERVDGYSAVTQMTALYGSFLYGFAAALLAYALARRRYGPGPALAGAFVGLVCGPILQYLVHQPSFAHAPSAFAVALLLYVWDRGRGDDATTRSLRGWVALGACIGVAMLMRGQNLVFALPAVVEGVRRVVAGPRAGGSGAVGTGGAGVGAGGTGGGWRAVLRAAAAPAAGAAAAIVCFLPQILAWKSIYGFALGVPQDAAYLQWWEPAWSEVLFSARNGLFVFAPLWLVGFFGLFVVLRRERWTGAVLLLTFALAIWVNGAVIDWWAIGSIGARRFDGVLVHMTLGFAIVARAALDAVERRPRVAAGVALGVVVSLFGRCNYSLTDHFTRVERLGEPDSRDSLRTYLGVAERDGRKLWAWGNPLSLPAALAFSWRTGAPASKYEQVVGPYLLIGIALKDFQGRPAQEKGALVFASPKHERFLTRGFAGTRKDSPDAKDGLRVGAGPRARVLVPLNCHGSVGVRLTGRALAPMTLRARWNGREVASVALAAGAPIDLSFDLDDATAERGVNVVDLLHDGVPPGTEAALYERMELRNPAR